MKTLLFLAAAFISTSALAQEPDQAPSTQDDTVRSLTERDLQGLQNGRGMGAGRVAELNGYPGPRHVLELANELELSDEQIEQTQLAFAAMRSAAVASGAEIIEAEQSLDALFAAHEADAASVQTALTQIGVMRARLRYVHIEAHMKMREILTDEQIEAYGRLRGEAHGQMRGQGQRHGQGQRQGQGQGQGNRQHRPQSGQQ